MARSFTVHPKVLGATILVVSALAAATASAQWITSRTPRETPQGSSTESQQQDTNNPRVQLALECRGTTTKWIGQRENVWRTYMAQFRSRKRLLPFVQSLISLSEKGQLVGDAVGMTDGQRARTRDLFRRYILDERVLIQELEEELQGCHEQLYKFDISLLGRLGAAKEQAYALSYQPFESQDWNVAITKVVDRAMQAAQYDAARWVATQAASMVVADGVVDATRAMGLNRHEEESLGDFLMRGMAEMLFSEVVDRATDPTNDIVADLQKALLQAENEILAGPNGLFVRMKNLDKRQTQLREAWLLRNLESSPSK